jgi:hypothetical protein
MSFEPSLACSKAAPKLATTRAKPVDRYLSDRPRLIREDLNILKEPCRSLCLRKLILRDKMDQAHPSGFLVSHGFAHFPKTLNGLEYHTNLVAHEFAGKYPIKPGLLEALATVIAKQENQ